MNLEEIDYWLKFFYNKPICYKSGEDKEISFAKVFMEFKELQQENQQLKEELECTIPIVEHNRIINEKNEEIHQLKDNWDKLKEYCKENVLCYEVGDGENTKLIGSRIHGLNVLDKMQELEQGNGSNVKD